jgi:tripartite-type tricarboxylate transporter receptor subunit TctC
MRERRSFLASSAGLAAGALLGPLGARAQSDAWPARQALKIVVPFAAGGTSDALARLLAQRLQEVLKQNVVVDNKAGAGGVIGADAVAKAAPDGYTIVLGTIASHAINPVLQAKMPYDAVKDFAPTFFIGNIPNVLLVNAALPVKNVRELIAMAKAKPGTMGFGTAGPGSSQHLSGEKFKLDAKIDITHVPYKGSAPSMQDLIAGQIPMSFDTALVALPHIESGKVRALAVTSGKRTKVLPDTPTLAESGLPGFDVASWQCLFAPAATPPAIVARIHDELAKIVLETGTAARLYTMGVEHVPMSTAQISSFQQAELVKWAKVVREAQVKV